MIGLWIGLGCAQLADAPSPPVAAATPAVEPLSGLEAKIGTGDGPRVVALHGLGDAPERFVRLFDSMTTPAQLLLPAAPIPYGDGFSWFALDRGSDAAFAAELAARADWLADRLEGKPILTGFSQGGMLAFAIAVRHPERITAAIPIGGALPLSLIPARAPAGAAPIIALHGGDDDRVPIDGTRASVAALTQRGFTASLREYGGVGHHISPQMRRDLDALLAQQSQ